MAAWNGLYTAAVLLAAAVVVVVVVVVSAKGLVAPTVAKDFELTSASRLTKFEFAPKKVSGVFLAAFTPASDELLLSGWVSVFSREFSKGSRSKGLGEPLWFPID